MGVLTEMFASSVPWPRRFANCAFVLWAVAIGVALFGYGTIATFMIIASGALLGLMMIALFILGDFVWTSRFRRLKKWGIAYEQSNT